jgi:hypothetical protein
MGDMDPVVKALLLSLAENLDPGVLGPLADRLEELGDARAVGVRAGYDCYRDGCQSPEEHVRVTLGDFPEGPRWFLVETVPGGARCLHGLHLTPGDAAAAAERHNGGLNLYPARPHNLPHWPAPA